MAGIETITMSMREIDRLKTSRQWPMEGTYVP